MGRIDPSEALVANTSVFVIEMPIALIPSPNRIEPKPQMKPEVSAIISARAGAAART